MFEKSRSSNLSAAAAQIPATLTLNTGERTSGHLLAGGLGRIGDVLNAPSAFVEFRSHCGQTRHFNKSAIVSIETLDVPDAGQLSHRNPDSAVFDPFQVLGISSNATQADVRQAYLNMARQYHPDQFASAGLPREVTSYMTAMAKRINTAWQMLSHKPVNSEMAQG